jgi:hypothetical protein
LDGNYEKVFNWNIDWGDGSTIEHATSDSTFVNEAGSAGILHMYNDEGKYTITITPDDGSTDAWLGSFGFDSSSVYGANVQNNREKIVEVLSPLTPLMTRTAAQLASGEAPDYEWAYTFAGCTNLQMGDDFTFSSDWDTITSVGNFFAFAMFSGCGGEGFTMNEVFNLPQSITSVGDSFVYGMFLNCGGDGFVMNDVFNLPVGITSAGNTFVHSMFMSCGGDGFVMNDVFNLPVGITSAGGNFAVLMFSGCNGDGFSMNDVFNLPQGITTVGTHFADNMFSSCSGSGFMVNDVFVFPKLSDEQLFQTRMFHQTFYNLGDILHQTRTATDIINGNSDPNNHRYTFTGSDCFVDRHLIHEYWGGDPKYAVTYYENWPSGTSGMGSVPVDSLRYVDNAVVTVLGVVLLWLMGMCLLVGVLLLQLGVQLSLRLLFLLTQRCMHNGHHLVVVTMRIGIG